MTKFLLTAELQIRGPANLAEARRRIEGGLKDVDIDVKISGASRAKAEIESIDKAVRKTQGSVQDLSRTVAISLKRFATYSVATRAVGLLTNGLAGAFNQAIEFERSMVRAGQAAGKSLTQIKPLSDEITRLSIKLGVTSTSLADVSTILIQAGLSASDTKIALDSLAKTQLAPTFDDISETAEGAVALFNQFGQGAEALERQLGAINTVSAKFAVESGDLISAVRRVGGVFKSSGGDLNELLALFTSIRATTRESGESIATGLRTIFVRIQRPKTLKFLEEMGVKLTDFEGKFVGPYRAIQLMNEEFAKFEERDPRFIRVAEEIAGFRQIGKVIPLLQQFNVAQEAYKAALDGQESLTRDAETAQQALAVRIVMVKEEFLALVREIYNSPVFQFMADSSLQLASSLTKVGTALKDIIPLLGLFATIKIAKGVSGFFGRVGRNLVSPKGYNTGGLVPGSGNTDTVPAMLTPGEFVINKKAVQSIGMSTLSKLNKVSPSNQVDGFSPNLTTRGNAPANVGRRKQAIYQKIDYLKSKKESGGLTLEEDLILKSLTAQVKQIQKSRGPRFSDFLFSGRVKGFQSGGLVKTSDLYNSKAQGIITLRKTIDNTKNWEGKDNLFVNYKTVEIDPLSTTDEKLKQDYIRTKTSSNGTGENSNVYKGYAFEAIVAKRVGKKINPNNDFLDFPYGEIKASRNYGLTTGLGTDAHLSLLAKSLNERSSYLKSFTPNLDTVAATQKELTLYIDKYRRLTSEQFFNKVMGGSVPGTGNTDTVPAMLTPGEFVINKKAAKNIGYGNLQAMNNGSKKRVSKKGVQYLNSGGYVGIKPQPHSVGVVVLDDTHENQTKTLAKDHAFPDKPVRYGNEGLPIHVLKGSSFEFISPDPKTMATGSLYDAMNESVISGLKTLVSNTSQDLVKKFAVSPDIALTTLQSNAESIFNSGKGKDIVDPVRGYMFEAVTSAITGASRAGGNSSFDFNLAGKDISSGQIDKVAQLFNDERIKKLKLLEFKGDKSAVKEAIPKSADYVSKNLGNIASSNLANQTFGPFDLSGIHYGKPDIAQLPKKGEKPENIFTEPFIRRGVLDKGAQAIARQQSAVASIDKVVELIQSSFTTGEKIARLTATGNVYTESGRLTKSQLEYIAAKDKAGFIASSIKKGAKRGGVTLEQIFDTVTAKFNTGGIVPGSGNRDTVPAMLTPGEMVINKKASRAIGYENLAAMNRGELPVFGKGGVVGNVEVAKSFQRFNRENDPVVRSLPEAQTIVVNFIDALQKFGRMFEAIKSQPVTALSKSDSKKYEGLAREDSIGIALGTATRSTVRHEASHQMDRAIGQKAPGMTPFFNAFASNQKGTLQNAITEKLKPVLQKQLKLEGASVEEMEYRLKNEEIFADLMERTTPKVRAILVHTTSAEKGLRLLSQLIEQSGNLPGLAGLSAEKVAKLPRGKEFKKPSYYYSGGVVKKSGLDTSGTIFKPRGIDTEPAMLAPNEFVVNRTGVGLLGLNNLSRANKGQKPLYAYGGGYVSNGLKYLYTGNQSAIKESFDRTQVLYNSPPQKFEDLSPVIEELKVKFSKLGGGLADFLKKVQAVRVEDLSDVEKNRKSNAGFSIADKLKAKQKIYGQATGDGKIVLGDAANKFVAKHEFGHQIDRGLGGGREFASRTKGTFQYDVAEKLKSRYKTQGNLQAYRADNAEIFADAFARVPKNIQELLVATTDAKVGAELMARAMNQAGKEIPGLADLEASDFVKTKGKKTRTPKPQGPGFPAPNVPLSPKPSYPSTPPPTVPSNKKSEDDDELQEATLGLGSFSAKLLAVSSGFTILSTVLDSVAEPGSDLARTLEALKTGIIRTATVVGLFYQIMKKAKETGANIQTGRAEKKKSATREVLQGKIKENTETRDNLQKRASGQLYLSDKSKDKIAKAQQVKDRALLSRSNSEASVKKAGTEISYAQDELSKAQTTRAKLKQDYLEARKNNAPRNVQKSLVEGINTQNTVIQNSRSTIARQESVLKNEQANIDKQTKIVKGVDRSSQVHNANLNNANSKFSELDSGARQANYLINKDSKGLSNVGASDFSVDAQKKTSAIVSKAGGAFNGLKGAAGSLASKLGGLTGIIGGAGMIFVGLTQVAAVAAEYMQSKFLKQAEMALNAGNYDSFRFNSSKAAEYGKGASAATSAGGGALTGAAIGATLGLIAGPLGAAIGGTAGALIGGAVGAGIGVANAPTSAAQRQEVETKILEATYTKTADIVSKFSSNLISASEATKALTEASLAGAAAAASSVAASERVQIEEYDRSQEGFTDTIGRYFKGTVDAAYGVNQATKNFFVDAFAGEASGQVKSAEIRREEALKGFTKNSVAQTNTNTQKRIQDTTGQLEAIYGNNDITLADKITSANKIIADIKEKEALALVNAGSNEEVRKAIRDGAKQEYRIASQKNSLLLYQLKQEKELIRLKNGSLKAVSQFNLVSGNFAKSRASFGRGSVISANEELINSSITSVGLSEQASKATDDNFQRLTSGLGIKADSDLYKKLAEEAQLQKTVLTTNDKVLQDSQNIRVKPGEFGGNREAVIAEATRSIVGDSDYEKSAREAIEAGLRALGESATDQEIEETIKDSLLKAGQARIEAGTQGTKAAIKLELERANLAVASIQEITSLEQLLANQRLQSINSLKESLDIKYEFGGRAVSTDRFISVRQNAANADAGISARFGDKIDPKSVGDSIAQLRDKLLKSTAELANPSNDPTRNAELQSSITKAKDGFTQLTQSIKDTVDQRRREVEIIKARNSVTSQGIDDLLSGDTKGYERSKQAKALLGQSRQGFAGANSLSKEVINTALSSLKGQRDAGAKKDQNGVDIFESIKQLTRVAALSRGVRLSEEELNIASGKNPLSEEKQAEVRSLADQLAQISSIQLNEATIIVNNAKIQQDADKKSLTGFARGGIIGGGQRLPGNMVRNGDDIMIAAQRGEGVIKNSSMSILGSDMFNMINSNPRKFLQGFANGGIVSPQQSAASVSQAVSNTSGSQSLSNSILSQSDITHLNNFTNSTVRLSNAVEKLANSTISVSLAPTTVTVNVTASGMLKAMNEEIKDLINSEIAKKFNSFARTLDKTKNPILAAKSV